MFETAVIDTLAQDVPEPQWALEAAQNLKFDTVQLHCMEDSPSNTTKGHEGQRRTELLFTCYAKNSAAARNLCRRVANALRNHTDAFGQHTLVGWSLGSETGGFDKTTNMYFRDFTYNATYQEP